MKMLSKIFYITLFTALVIILMQLNKAAKIADNDKNIIQSKVYDFYVQHADLQDSVDTKNDYINQFSENDEFIDQMVRANTGKLKEDEIIYKFEEK